MNSDSTHSNKASKATPLGVLIAIGIIYGDIGTSPLYTMKAIIGASIIDEMIVYGGLSCVIWTLTLQTTLKYVWLTLQADNNGEGGIFSLFALVRRYSPMLVGFAIVGGSMLLADGIITPPISVASAVEGLRLIYPNIETVPIIIVILSLLFAIQMLGTGVVGKTFGPMMTIWFGMLFILGITYIFRNPAILKAFNPYYAYQLLVNYPNGFWLLGSVFLCTTGAEALYSDMGHCGRHNVRVSWALIKVCLLVNYLGQGAWLLEHTGQKIYTNPFFGIMPNWFYVPGIAIATLAAIIASQALITGSFTLISEAVRLNLWPKVRLVYPSNIRGQLYVPSVNWLLWFGCIGVVLYFRESSNMEAAYGLAITLTMMMTTILLSAYLYFVRRVSGWIILLIVLVYSAIELSFLAANLLKFMHGGYVSLIIGFSLIALMYIWRAATKIKDQLTEYTEIKTFLPRLQALSIDTSIAKYSTHLVYMTSSSRCSMVEQKVMHSILENQPKRADLYWFIHVETTNEPYTMAYEVKVVASDDVVRINFKLGFRVEPRIGLFLKKVVEDMIKNNEVDVYSRYQSLHKEKVIGDFKFVVLTKFLSYENDLPFYERSIMTIFFMIKTITNSERHWFGLDANSVAFEKVPLVIRPRQIELVRLK